MAAITEGRWGNGVEETAKAKISESREKWWSECSIEEKIERLRTVSKQKDDTIQFLRDAVYTLDRQLREHRHVEDKVMVAIDETRGVLDIRDRYPRPASDEVYI